jgi:two-component system, cell cycle response regulator DivK
MSFESWKVLIVEDDGDSLDGIQEIFRYHNIESYGAESAEAALKLLAQIRPSLAILDLALPEMDGWELLNLIRRDPVVGGIPVVAVTAFHSAKLVREAIDAGFNAYFSKPIDAVSFVPELERVLGMQ